jgi:Putative peptidase family
MRISPGFLLCLFLLGTPTALAQPLEPKDDAAEVYAWFLDPPGESRVVHYCVEASEAFPGAVGGLEETKNLLDTFITGGLKTWLDYFPQKGISVTEGGAPALATHFERQPRCDGTQDLTFYFGAGFPAVEPYRQQLSHPLGFAHREAYDESRGWGRGFVWIDYSVKNMDEEIVSGTVLHELGHLFGMEHVEGTIMDENYVEIVEEIEKARNSGHYQALPVANIDWKRELLISPFHFDYGIYALGRTGRDIEAAYPRLTGLNPRREPQTENLVWEERAGRPLLHFTLFDHYVHEAPTLWERLTDLTDFSWNSPRYYEFTITAAQGPELIPTSEGRALKRRYEGQDFSLQPSGFSWPARMHTPRGEELPVVVNRNLGNAVEILLLNGGLAEQIYTEVWW